MNIILLCLTLTVFIFAVRLSILTVPIHEGEARVRGQLACDNPDIVMV